MHAHPLPKYLRERFLSWRARRYEDDKAWYARLAADGQRPRAMVISCCDSRVDPVAFFGAEPGEIFMLRNVANIVPPYQSNSTHHGTSAAIEYAVTALRVPNIVVIGHAHCGGIAGVHDACAAGDAQGPGEFIGPWLEVMRPAYEDIAAMDAPREQRLRALEKRAVAASLSNLADFPFVQTAIKDEQLKLHGLWFDIAAGQLSAYDAQDDSFKLLEA